MGVFLRLVFDRHAADVSAPGKPIYAFQLGLNCFCLGILDQKDENYHWYTWLNEKAPSPLCEVCKPLLEAEFSYEYWELNLFRYSVDQYAEFNREVPDSGLTEDMFKDFVREGKNRQTKIEDCIHAVKFLLDLFKQTNPPIMEGNYRPEDTIPGYEELLERLETALKQNYKIVQLCYL